MDFIMQPIGVIHSPFVEKRETPIQSSRSEACGTIEVWPEFEDGLDGIDGFSHLILLYVFHQSAGYALHVKPFLDNKEHGLFATRYPERPNQIGISVVRLISRQGNVITIENVDVLDGTPLLDIKPYVADFDVHLDTRAGWYESRSNK